MHARKGTITKSALILSILLLILWSVLGAGTSIAYFTDTSTPTVNTFNIGEIDLEVSKVTWNSDQINDFTTESIENSTKVFDDAALYEPGYTQVVYLEIKNTGEIPFDYQMAVMVNGYQDGFSVTHDTIHLAEHLMFGVVWNRDLAVLKNDNLASRVKAQNAAKDPLTDVEIMGQYTQTWNTPLQPNDTMYAAVVVYMPETVGNEANHVTGSQPRVELGLSVKATQVGTISLS